MKEYLVKSVVVDLDATGSVTDDLMTTFPMPEYSSIDMSPLHQLGKRG